MPFKSISRHQPSQREPKLSWPSLTGKSLRVCRYHQNKTPQRSLSPKQQQSSNPKQQRWRCVKLLNCFLSHLSDDWFHFQTVAPSMVPLVRMRFSICFSSFEAKLWFRRPAEEFSVQKQTWTTIKKNRNKTVNPLQSSYHYQPVKCLKCLKNVCK